MTSNLVYEDIITGPYTGPPPSIARTVHYVSAGSADGRYPSVCRCAFITEIPEHADKKETMMNPGTVVNLKVESPEGGHRPHYVPYAEPGETLKPYTWHWPERV